MNASSDMSLEVMLSAYLDDRDSLNAEEIDRVESLLASDAGARQTYAELQSVVSGLQHLEAVAAPRSYHLDVEMVGAPEPVQLTTSNAWYERHAGAVRWATAAAAVIFVFVLGADLVLNSVFTNPSDSSDSMSPGANQSQLSDAGEADDEAVEEEADGAESGAAEMVPPSQGDQDDSGGDAAGGSSDEADDSSAGEGTDGSEPETLLEASPEDIPTPQVDQPDSEPISDDDSARSSDDDDDAARAEPFAFDESAGETSDESSDRRIWRVVEFSLVVILALLITAMVILPRISGSPRRR